MSKQAERERAAKAELVEKVNKYLGGLDASDEYKVTSVDLWLTPSQENENLRQQARRTTPPASLPAPRAAGGAGGQRVAARRLREVREAPAGHARRGAGVPGHGGQVLERAAGAGGGRARGVPGWLGLRGVSGDRVLAVFSADLWLRAGGGAADGRRPGECGRWADALPARVCQREEDQPTPRRAMRGQRPRSARQPGRNFCRDDLPAVRGDCAAPAVPVAPEHLGSHRWGC
ncbi:hypothetical protein QJS66_19260 [Kocuria rhizophila]|nr:hypothetical protein QJS66_19260 [Kocuria rhizophila]